MENDLQRIQEDVIPELAEEEAARLRALASGTEAIDSTTDGVIISKPAKVYNSLGVLS